MYTTQNVYSPFVAVRLRAELGWTLNQPARALEAAACVALRFPRSINRLLRFSKPASSPRCLHICLHGVAVRHMAIDAGAHVCARNPM